MLYNLPSSIIQLLYHTTTTLFHPLSAAENCWFYTYEGAKSEAGARENDGNESERELHLSKGHLVMLMTK